MESFEEKVKEAREAIVAVFDDKSVGVEDTEAALQGLIDEIKIKLEALKAL